MSQIISHGEVLASIKDGNTTVAKIAVDLAVSEATARKYATEMVERGWLTCRETTEVRQARTIRFKAYWLTLRGHDALATNEGW